MGEHFDEKTLCLGFAAVVACGVAGGLLLSAWRGAQLKARSPFRDLGGGQLEAHIVERSESMGWGCAVQFLGLLLTVAGIFSLSILLGGLGLAIIIIGGRQARFLQCSACAGRIAEHTASICPHCRSRLR